MTATASRPLAELPLTEQLPALLSAIYSGCRGGVRVRSKMTMGPPDVFGIPIEPGLERRLNPVLLRELSFHPAPDVFIQLATIEGDGTLLDVPAYWLEVVFEQSWSDEKGRHVIAQHADQALAPLRAFQLPPSFVIDQRWGVTAVWLLSTPIAVEAAEKWDQVVACQRRIAEQLGGRCEDITDLSPSPGASHVVPPPPPRSETLPAWHPSRIAMRVPGSRTREASGGMGHPVILASADLARRFAPDELTAALDVTARNSRTAGGRKRSA